MLPLFPNGPLLRDTCGINNYCWTLFEEKNRHKVDFCKQEASAVVFFDSRPKHQSAEMPNPFYKSANKSNLKRWCQVIFVDLELCDVLILVVVVKSNEFQYLSKLNP